MEGPLPTLAGAWPADALPMSSECGAGDCDRDCDAPPHAARSPRPRSPLKQQQQQLVTRSASTMAAAPRAAVGANQPAGAKPPKWQRTLLGCWQTPSVAVITTPQQQCNKHGLTQPAGSRWRSLLKPKASGSSGGGGGAAPATTAAALGLIARQSSASRDSCGSLDDACVRVTIGQGGSGNGNGGAEPCDKQHFDPLLQSLPPTPRSPPPAAAARAAALSRASLRAPSVMSDVAQWHDAASAWGGSDAADWSCDDDVAPGADVYDGDGYGSSHDGSDGSRGSSGGTCYDVTQVGLVAPADLATALARAAPLAPATAAAMAAAALRCLGGERALLRAASAASLAPLTAPPPHVPNPPLFFAEREYTFVPVPRRTPFAGYWLNDMSRATPHPQPIDLMLGVNSLALVAHKSIPGLWLRETPTTFTMCARALALPIGPFARYVEPFAKDGSTATWPARRDVRVGRSYGQLYYTSCGTLVFRVTARGLFGGAPEYVVEDYSTLSPCGKEITTRQVCVHLPSGRVAEQYLAGTYVGPDAPAGHF